MNMEPVLLPALRGVLAGRGAEVELALLFGSTARGETQWGYLAAQELRKWSEILSRKPEP
jgi:hypothetical protein